MGESPVTIPTDSVCSQGTGYRISLRCFCNRSVMDIAIYVVFGIFLGL